MKMIQLCNGSSVRRNDGQCCKICLGYGKSNEETLFLIFCKLFFTKYLTNCIFLDKNGKTELIVSKKFLFNSIEVVGAGKDYS
ncbi:hypothetical protein [Neobacillus drentensis]|uniref:hypothetical protein n=1 Tax=Neobacillus drentensis TaxID=220684 RepID=UPI002FFD62AF